MTDPVELRWYLLSWVVLFWFLVVFFAAGFAETLDSAFWSRDIAGYSTTWDFFKSAGWKSTHSQPLITAIIAWELECAWRWCSRHNVTPRPEHQPQPSDTFYEMLENVSKAPFAFTWPNELQLVEDGTRIVPVLVTCNEDRSCRQKAATNYELNVSQLKQLFYWIASLHKCSLPHHVTQHALRLLFPLRLPCC